MVSRNTAFRYLIITSLGISLSTLLAGDSKKNSPLQAESPQQNKVVAILPDPNSAVEAAWLDAQALPAGDAVFTRYLWYPSMEDAEAKVAAIGLNAISRSPLLRKPTPVPGALLRVNLTKYAPQTQDLADWLRFWEDLQFDPFFSLILTPDELANLSPSDQHRFQMAQRPSQQEPVLIESKPVMHFDRRLGGHCRMEISAPVGTVARLEDESGTLLTENENIFSFTSPAPLDSESKIYTYTVFLQLLLPLPLGKAPPHPSEKTTIQHTYHLSVKASYLTTFSLHWSGTAKKNSDEIVRFDSEAINPVAFGQLQQMCRTAAPVVSVPYFLMRTLSTIKDEDELAYSTVFGGRYYEFVGVKKVADVKGAEGKTDEDIFLANLGVADVSLQGFSAQQVFDQLRSDQRVAMLRSEVTSRERRIDLLQARAARKGQNKGFITHDLKRKQVDVKNDPIRNLIDFKDAAREAIFPKANGLHLYAIFNGAGKLLDVADQDVVSDRTVPSPYHPELQPAISCLACHEADGSDGWKPVRNDVRLLTNPRKQRDALNIDIFADLSNINLLQADQLDRLAGLYAGDFTDELMVARNDYARAVLLAGGPWPGSEDQVNVVKVAISSLVKIARGYQYDQIDAHQALKELGLWVHPKESVATLNIILPPDKESFVNGIFLEDPYIGALKKGGKISRYKWSLVYGFAARRAQKGIAIIRKGLKTN